MATLRIEIRMENEAFVHPVAEVRRILREYQPRILDLVDDAMADSFKLMDVNGNTCGRVMVEDD